MPDGDALTRLAAQIVARVQACDLTQAEVRTLVINVLIGLLYDGTLATHDLPDLPIRVLEAHLAGLND